MNYIINGNESFRLPGNQICIFVHNERKFCCDVDSLIADYKGKSAQLVSVNKVFNKNSVVDAEYAMKTVNKNPIIIVRFDDGTYEVLDGNHRLFKAVHERQAQIMAHILNEVELYKYDC